MTRRDVAAEDCRKKFRVQLCLPPMAQAWFDGLWSTTRTAQLPSVELSKLMLWELVYSIEEVLFVGIGLLLALTVAYFFDLASIFFGFLALIVFGFVFCRDLANVYFTVWQKCVAWSSSNACRL